MDRSGTYTYVRSREDGTSVRQDLTLTPRHSAGFVGMWEEEDRGRVGLEVYYTGRQRLEVNPYRVESKPYVIVGMLVEKRVGPARLFLNAENVMNVRQTTWDSLLRPARGVDGRWTVDAWAPVDGRTINGGVRVGFELRWRALLTERFKSTASQRRRASSNVSSLVVDERHVYWIEAGMLRRRERG